MTGEKIYSIAKEIFPICRSLTGDGVRKTLDILKKYMPDMQTVEIPTGTQAYDWTVPKEWNIKGGYIADEQGHRVIDFKDNNLYIMGYSVSVDKWVGLDELLNYVYTEEKQPEVIPYVTSYYQERFGFCMSENQKRLLKPGNYHMVIDSELKDGFMTYGEVYLPGDTQEEILFSSYICHPSMANNECSGPSLMAALYNKVKGMKNRRYSYRFLLMPETIGVISYLSRHLAHMKKAVKAGYVLTCVGDNLSYSMIQSRYGNSYADKVLNCALKSLCPSFKTYSFLERGSDERQYCAPGVDLPVATFCRSKFHEYPEYHTSADDLNFISPQGFEGSYMVMNLCIEILENNYNYCIGILCEPQLGKRGLYPTISKKGTYNDAKIITNFIAFADGSNDLIDISNLIHADIRDVIKTANQLKEKGLMEEHNV